MKKDSPISAFVERLGKDRKLEVFVYCALILTAVIIFLASGGISCSGGAKNEASSGQQSTASELEQRLAEMLSSMAGVGEVRVLLTYDTVSPGAGLYGGSGLALFGSSGGTERSGVVSGVMIAAEGAEDIGTAVRLRDAVTTLLGVEPSRVCVFAMRGR